MKLKITAGLILHSALAFAEPQGFHLISGDAKISQTEGKTIVHCGPFAEIQWDDFSLASNENVFFIQPSKDAVVKNYVKNTASTMLNGSIAAKGGIHFEFDQEAHLSGTILARGADVLLKGRSLSIEAGAKIDVSGDEKAGSILISGFEKTNVHKGAQLLAENNKWGEAGRISILGEKDFSFAGYASAASRGEGDGGYIEIISKESFEYLGSVDLRATKGENGSFFLDPKYAVISSQAFLNDENTLNPHAQHTVYISGEALSQALETAHVVIQANSDIYFDDQVISKAEGNGLSLQAGRSIIFEQGAKVSLKNAEFNAVINDDRAFSDQRECGVPQFIMKEDALVTTDGGDLSIKYGQFGGISEGEINLGKAMLDANGGHLHILGVGGFEGNGRGIRINETTLKTTNEGHIRLSGAGTLRPGDGHVGLTIHNGKISVQKKGLIILGGKGGAGMNNNLGIHLTGSDTLIEAENGCIHLTGLGSGKGDHNEGVRIEDGVKIRSTKSAQIFMHGLAAAGNAWNYGISVSGAETRISSEAGAIIMIGHGQGYDMLNQGIRLQQGAKVISTGQGIFSAPIHVHGLGGQGQTQNNGIVLCDNGTEVSSVDGDILLVGSSAPSSIADPSVLIEDPAMIKAKGRGKVKIRRELLK